MAFNLAERSERMGIGRRDAGEDGCFYSKTFLQCPNLHEKSRKKLALFVGNREKKNELITACCSLPAVGVWERAAM